LTDTDEDKAKSFKDLLKNFIKKDITVYKPDSLKSAVAMDIIVNATPLGLKETDDLPIPKEFLIGPSQIVIDLIYKETPLLKEAKKKGCRTINGLGMLLWQGVLASQLWTGQRPPVDVMRSALARAAGGRA
jgi:shikimate dehydrogenase